jgi:hypothetical protein
MPLSLIPLISQPGIKRDGTIFEGGAHVDGRWVRWQRGRPRKILGYQSIVSWSTGPMRAVHVHPRNDTTLFHAGSASTLERVAIDYNGTVIGGVFDRTPVGFAANANNDWQLAAMRNSAGPNQALLAWSAPNLDDIANETARTVYIGDITATTALTAISGSDVDGGIAVLQPYFVRFGSGGFVGWSDINQPTVLASGDAGTAFVTDAKIVCGLPYRGGSSNSPAGLLWSLNSLLRMSFIGGTAIFRFDHISSQTSILSSNGVIEYDGMYFWAGLDRFLMFNGVVSEVPNPYNSNWFFDNLNYAQRQKVFAFKVPRYGEIWWCYPRGTATECTHAVIYNVREQVWYDTELDGGARTAGAFAQGFRYPVMSNWSGGTARLMQHEYGVDGVIDGRVEPINSFYELADISTLIPQGSKQSDNHQIRIERIEPDFVQTGDMTIQVKGRANARAPEVDGPIKTFSPTDQVVWVKEQRRELRLRIGSNTVGGDYQTGEPIGHIGTGDGTMLG